MGKEQTKGAVPADPPAAPTGRTGRSVLRWSRSVTLGAFVAVALVATACSGGEDPPVGGPVDAAGSTPTSEAAPSGPESAAAAETVARLQDQVGQEAGPGCAVAVGHRGEVVLAEAAGLADLETGETIEVDTTFDIASTSKQFTALAVLLAEEAGALSLSDGLDRWVPEVVGAGPVPTLDQLVHHQSGLVDYIDLLVDEGYGYRERTTTEDALAALADDPGREFAPGEGWSYSNSNYFLLGVAVERSTGVPLPEFLATEVFAPLGLAMDMDPIPPPGPGAARSYERAGDGWRPADSAWEQVGDGAVRTTAVELVRWADAWSTAPFGDEVLAAQLDSVATGEGTRYGAGIESVQEGDGVRLFHSGGWSGFATDFVVDPRARVAVAVTCNRPDLPGPGLDGDSLLDLWVEALGA